MAAKQMTDSVNSYSSKTVIALVNSHLLCYYFWVVINFILTYSRLFVHLVICTSKAKHISTSSFTISSKVAFSRVIIILLFKPARGKSCNLIPTSIFGRFDEYYKAHLLWHVAHAVRHPFSKKSTQFRTRNNASRRRTFDLLATFRAT